MSVLSAENLSFTRGGRTVLEGVGFSLAAGALLLLTGPNGSGKSTLLRGLAGLLPPSAGRMTVLGQEYPCDYSILSQNFFWFGMEDALNPALSIKENMLFFSALLGAPAQAVPQALAAFGVLPLADMPVRRLSAGLRRRAALARLLLAPRKLWLLDEPANSLDAEGRKSLGLALLQHTQKGGAAVLSTHEPEVYIEGSLTKGSFASVRVLRLGQPGDDDDGTFGTKGEEEKRGKTG